MSTTLVERFGIAVRRQREAQGWSQELLAERADLNRSYVGEIERGRVIPSLVTSTNWPRRWGCHPICCCSWVSRWGSCVWPMASIWRL